MKKRITILLCLAPMLLACGQSPSSASSEKGAQSADPARSDTPVSSSATASSEQASQAQDSSSSGQTQGDYLFYKLNEGEDLTGIEGSPWVNSAKQGVAKKLAKPSLKDDFYLNKTYETQLNAKLEKDDIAVGGMPGAIKSVSEKTTKMLTEKTDSPYSDPMRAVYNLYKKEDKSAEVNYVKGLIDEIKAISSLDALVEYLVNKGYDSVWPLFEIAHASANKLFLRENNMGLTPSSVNYSYLNSDETSKQRVLATSVYLLGLYGYNEADAKALLDSATNTYSECTRERFGNESTTISSIDSKYEHLRLSEYLTSKLGYKPTDEVVIQGVIDSLLKTLSSAWTPGASGAYVPTLAEIKNMLIFRLAFVSAISRNVTGENGYIELTEGLNNNAFGYNVDMFEKDMFATYFQNVYDRLYLDNYETKERRNSILSLMKDISAEYKALLNGSTWLDEATRKEASDKLDAMTFDACYPVSLDSLPQWNYGSPSSFMEAVNNYSAWSRLASQPVNANIALWAGSVTTVNGVYSPDTNSFVIYDGLMAGDGYSLNMAKEELYGSIGAVIGHEISHAFDVGGSTYDKDGQQRDWWSDKDRAAFQTKVDRIKAVWSTYENKPGMKLSCDEAMLSEIIADMGGLSVCLRLGAKEENFDYDKFFSAYAGMHGTIMSEEALNNFVYGGQTGKQDSHPISVFRVNGVVNQFEKFYSTYDIKDGNKMFVPANERLNIWG